MKTRKMKSMPLVLSTILLGSMMLAGCSKTGVISSPASPAAAEKETAAPSAKTRNLIR